MQNKTELCFQKLLYVLLLLLFGFQLKGSWILYLYLQQVTWVKSKGTLHFWKLTHYLWSFRILLLQIYWNTGSCLSFIHALIFNFFKEDSSNHVVKVLSFWSKIHQFIWFFYFLYIFLWFMLDLLYVKQFQKAKYFFCHTCMITLLLIAFFFSSFF